MGHRTTKTSDMLQHGPENPYPLKFLNLGGGAQKTVQNKQFSCKDPFSNAPFFLSFSSFSLPSPLPFLLSSLPSSLYVIVRHAYILCEVHL